MTAKGIPLLDGCHALTSLTTFVATIVSIVINTKNNDPIVRYPNLYLKKFDMKSMANKDVATTVV